MIAYNFVFCTLIILKVTYFLYFREEIKERQKPLPNRKRLLSDRGEQELANFPVIDVQNVKNDWKGCSFVVGNS